MVIVIGIAFILFGLLYLFAGDVMWSWQKFGNDLEGQVSRRGETWEIKRVFTGVLLVIVGVIFAIAGFAI